LGRGRNIRVEYRFAAGDPVLYKAYADELVGLRPDAILAGATPAVAVLQPMTRTIPIVFVLTADPVGQGFVRSLARPGGNITGFSVYDAPMMGKCLGLFKEIAPGLRHVAVIFNPDTASIVHPECGQAIACRRCDDRLTMGDDKTVRQNDHAPFRLLRLSGNCRFDRASS
jgi:ABC-type uncharacterized transport system substrate-binding protein